MNDLCNEYYKPLEYTLNPEVLVSHLKESKIEYCHGILIGYKLLKFWIYLTDTGSENGAMEYCPGTHWEDGIEVNFIYP